MQVRVVSAVAGLLVALFFGASLAGASSSFKRYTMPAAPPLKVASPGTLTMLFPSDWQVKTTWAPSANDPMHGTSVWWSVSADLEPSGTTLADIRAHASYSGCRDVWGYENPGRRRQIGDTYLTLPVGTMWRQTERVYADKGQCDSAAQGYLRQYTLDRKAMTDNGRKVFLVFTIYCGINECQAHNGQLAAIMHSIRLQTP